MTKMLQMIINQTIICEPGFKKIILLHTIAPIGVGGIFFMLLYFDQK